MSEIDTQIAKPKARLTQSAVPALELLRWFAWTPRFTTALEWREWISNKELPDESIFVGEATPAIDFIPIAMRKKLSQLTKVSLHVAHHCLTAEERLSMATIFASRHGESAITAELLDSIAKDEPLSPMGFSRSVHNTASGLFGIIERNQAPTTALAAGDESFAAGLIETALQIASDSSATPRLLVYADERIPVSFQSYVKEPPVLYGAAFLFGPSTNNHTSKIFADASVPVAFPHALSFLFKYLRLQNGSINC